MDIEDYKARLKEITKEAENRIRKLKLEYASSNAPAAVGDVVTDRLGSILVESIKIYPSDPPQCVFYGRKLTKKLVPTKDGKTRGIYQQNLVK